MRRVRVIPILLLQDGGLVKSVRFRNHKYVGDPINAVRIFNEKEVDEIMILDISATLQGRKPDLKAIREYASEAFMPLAYGGGITRTSEIRDLLNAGVEKVVLNTSVITNPKLISEGARYVGSQSIVISVDVKKNIWGRYRVHVRNGAENTKIDPIDFARQVEQEGAGEIVLNSIDRDGTFSGFDIDLIKKVSEAVKIPVVASGGASSIEDFLMAVQSGASAVAAGSMFVFQRPHRAVLISYPDQVSLKERLFSRINN